MAADAEPIREQEEWQRERERMLGRIELLKRQGVCYVCRDLETKSVFGEQHVIHEDEEFRIVLDPYPRVEGQTILVYKPHREDLSVLPEQEVGPVFRMLVRVVKAVKEGLQAEKVYVLTMSDGQPSHLSFQLLPRWPGNLMGYKRLTMGIRPLENGEETAGRIRRALLRRQRAVIGP